MGSSRSSCGSYRVAHRRPHCRWSCPTRTSDPRSREQSARRRVCASRSHASATRTSRCTRLRNVMAGTHDAAVLCTWHGVTVERSDFGRWESTGLLQGRAWVIDHPVCEHALDRSRDVVDRQFDGHAAESALGIGLHVPGDSWPGLRLRRVRHRCPLPAGLSAGACPRRCGTDFVLDALEQAIYARGGARPAGLVHHSDQGTQYLTMRYTDRLAEAGIAPSVGSRGNAYDNALGGIGDWTLQDGGDSTTRSVAESGHGGIRHADVD